MEFKEGVPLYSYEVRREAGEDVLYFNYLGASFIPSLEDSPFVMERTINALIENPNVSRIVFVQQKNYNYDFKETTFLLEISLLYNYLVKQEKVLSPQKLISSKAEESELSRRYGEIFNILSLLKKDPIVGYFDLKKLIFQVKSSSEANSPTRGYLHLLENMRLRFEQTSLISSALSLMQNYKRGDREIYKKLFAPDVIPNFSFTRLVSDLPSEGEIVAQYKISVDSYDESMVTILKNKDSSTFLYHLQTPENSLSEEQAVLLNLARNVLIEHQPKAEEFTDTERVRQVFFNISRDLIGDLATSKSLSLSFSDLNKLATILVRHTIGFGIIEILLQDKNLQDIVLNSPIPLTNIFVKHQGFGNCSTNILPSQEDVDSWAAKFRMISGRPLDESNPVLDTQLGIGNLRARIAIVQQPLSPDGLAYAIRRHREDPWTLPLFIKNKMMDSTAAGLLSFLIDGSRTLLIAGTRSSGKTSVLGSLMLESLMNNRTIVVEDTLELPVESMRKLGYDILRMKVRSSLLKSSTEVAADEGIRTSLRLGDSSLIIGEIRSIEAKALYEAMRVGALANVVAGTIHGASPYAVFDRVVNDLGVPVTSFKATDIVAVANPVKSPDGLSSFKRLISISEVRKHWIKDPLEEGGFVDLMKYNVEKDILEVSDDLKNGDSEVLKDIASNVRGWAGNWDAVWDNILLRAKIKQELVDVSVKSKIPRILEAEFNSRSNTIFHKISQEVSQEIGIPESTRVFPEWQKWLNSELKKRKI